MAPPGRNPWILKPPKTRTAAQTPAREQQASPAPHRQDDVAAPPRLSLFCFPPAGSGAYVYHGWEKQLPADVEVLPVELPGRNSRANEAPYTSMDRLVDALLTALLPLMEARPFAFFGHSMGAWVAAALAAELQRRVGPLPEKIYASANRSPLLAATRHDVDSVVMHTLAPPAFWAAMEARYGRNPALEHPSVRSMLLPMLQADFRLLETWQPRQWPDGAAARGGEPGALQRLPCPVAALGATADRRYTPAQLEAWREVAPEGAFQLQWFQGGHFYATEDCPGRRDLLEWLAADLHAPKVGGDGGSAMAVSLQGTSASDEACGEPASEASAEEGQPEVPEPAVGSRAQSGGALSSMVQVLEVMQVMEQQVQPLLRGSAWAKGDSASGQPAAAGGGVQAAAPGGKRAVVPVRRRKWRMCWLCWGCVGVVFF